MAKARARVKPVADVIESTLKGMINDFEAGGKAINGALTIDGHEHWWFLEFGTGKQFDPEGNSTDLTRPAGIKAGPGGYPGNYPIEPKGKPITLPNGKVKYPKLSFYWHRKRKWMHFRIVHHPGIAPRGMVRLAIREFRSQLFDALNRLAEEDTIPDRDDLVGIVNTLLLDMMRDLRKNMPVGSVIEDKSDGDHLRDAIGIIPAK